MNSVNPGANASGPAGDPRQLFTYFLAGEPEQYRRLAAMFYKADRPDMALGAYKTSYEMEPSVRAAFGAFLSSVYAALPEESGFWLEEFGRRMRELMVPHERDRDGSLLPFRDTAFCSLAFSCLVRHGFLDGYEDIIVIPAETDASEDICARLCEELLIPGLTGTGFASALFSACVCSGWAGACYERVLITEGTDGASDKVRGILFGSEGDPGSSVRSYLCVGECSCGREKQDALYEECFMRLLRSMTLELPEEELDSGFRSVCRAVFLAGTVLERKMLGGGEWSGSADPDVLSRKKEAARNGTDGLSHRGTGGQCSPE